MKLLSMKIGDANHAGIVVGGKVLDVTALAATGSTSGTEWLESHSRLEDALDLYRLGVEKLSALGEAHKEAGPLLPLGSIKLKSPGLRPGKNLAVGFEYGG